MGLLVDVAYRATSALAKIEEVEPDIVILDVEMPFGDGLSICEMMATHEETANIPVIILTGRSDRETIRRCHELGAYHVVKKGNIWLHLEPLLRELAQASPPMAHGLRTPLKPLCQRL
jgi:DNA-binding response OmpR family regulator